MWSQLHQIHFIATVALLGLIGLMVLLQCLASGGAAHAERCAFCGYNLGKDRRRPNYCPQCGTSKLQEAHRLRRQELLLELERLQMELVRNHREQIALRYTESGIAEEV